MGIRSWRFALLIRMYIHLCVSKREAERENKYFSISVLETREKKVFKLMTNIFSYSTAEVRKWIPIVCYSLCSLWPSLEDKPNQTKIALALHMIFLVYIDILFDSWWPKKKMIFFNCYFCYHYHSFFTKQFNNNLIY